MNEPYRCPNCGNLATRYRRTRGDHICQRCGHQWARLGVNTRPNRLKSALIMSAVALVIVVVFALLGDFFWLVPAIGVWGYTYYLLRKGKKDSDDSTAHEYVVTADGEVVAQNDTEVYHCTNPNCGQELSADEEFCSKCGSRRVRSLADTQYLVCGSCNRELEPATQYCPGCGTEVIRRR